MNSIDQKREELKAGNLDLSAKLDAILGTSQEKETCIEERSNKWLNICWFSELLARICESPRLGEDQRIRITEVRKAYIDTLRTGDDARNLFDSIMDLIACLAAEVSPPNVTGGVAAGKYLLTERPSAAEETADAVLDVHDNNMSDEQLKGFLLKRTSPVRNIKTVNLSGNQLSDIAVRQLLTDMADSECKLEELNLSHNPYLTDKLTSTLSDIVRSLKLTHIRSLSLTGIHMNGPALAELLNNLNTSTTPVLDTLDLSDTQLGMRDNVGCDALAVTLSQIRKLSTLNISHNYLRSKHLRTIGESLALMDSICVLDVSANSGGMLPGEQILPAIATLCSILGSIASLQDIKLGRTGMNDETAFILADSLSNHNNIRNIDISGNHSIGSFGVIALLKLLLFKTGGVHVINLNDCICNSRTNLFNFADPSGTYSLNLEHLSDLAMARQCLNVWELSQTPIEKTLLGIEVDSKPYRPEKDDEGVWLLPEKGILRFTAVFKVFNNDGSPSVIGNATVIKEEELNRLISGVVNRIRSVEQKQLLIQAIANFVVFDCEISKIVETSGHCHKITELILEKLLPKSRDPLPTIASFRPLFTRLKYPFRFQSLQGRANHSRAYAFFNPENPSGSYRLNLADPCHRIAAVAAIHYAKIENDRFKDFTNFPVLRNSKLNGSAFEIMPGWNPSDSGTWEFDYVSPRRIETNQPIQPLEAQSWHTLVQEMALIHSDHGADECLYQLRKESHRILITCAQLVDLLLRFANMRDLQLDIAVTLIRRLSDYYNVREMLFRDRLGLPATFDASSSAQLERRVGKLALFNPLKLENTTSECDFGTAEGRVIAKTILTLLAKEKGSRLVNSRVGSTTETMTSGDPPKSWQSCLPNSGFWFSTYVVDEKSINMKLRKDLAVRLCGLDPRTIEKL